MTLESKEKQDHVVSLACLDFLAQPVRQVSKVTEATRVIWAGPALAILVRWACRVNRVTLDRRDRASLAFKDCADRLGSKVNEAWLVDQVLWDRPATASFATRSRCRPTSGPARRGRKPLPPPHHQQPPPPSRHPAAQHCHDRRRNTSPPPLPPTLLRIHVKLLDCHSFIINLLRIVFFSFCYKPMH